MASASLFPKNSLIHMPVPLPCSVLKERKRERIQRLASASLTPINKLIHMPVQVPCFLLKERIERLAAATSLPPMNTLIQVPVQPLPCSFPAQLHPLYEFIRAQCDPWIVSLAQPSSNTARQFLLDCLLPRFCCRIIPSGCTARLVLITKILSWLFVSDTDDDDPQALGADYVQSARRHQLIMAVLHNVGPRPTTHQKRVDGKTLAQMAALAEVWEEARKDMPARLGDRFIQAMALYFEAIKVQAYYRSIRSLPDEAAYVRICRPASFMLPAFALMEYALAIELEEDTYTSPLIMQLQNAVIDHICFSNDLISCRVENAVGNFFNMPSVLFCSAADDLSFHQAMDRVVELVGKADAECGQLVARIYSSGLADMPGVRCYVAGLCSAMSGNLCWSYETARYR